MISKTIDRIAQFFPCWIDSKDAFFEEYYICPGVKLHKFFGPGEAPGYHTHPWKWCVSVILTGGYTERVPDRVGIWGVLRSPEFNRIR